jgi:hypothetical protein
MKNFSLLSLVALVAIGCSEAPSGPGTDAAILSTQRTANASAFRPPPPALYDGVVSSEFGVYSGFTGSYFLNGPGSNGWISFDKQQPTGTSLSSPSARITFKDGELSGQGVLTLTGSTGNKLVIDLKTGITGGLFSGSCGFSCGSVQLRGTETTPAGKITTNVTATLRNPAYDGGEVVIGDFTHG